MKSKVEAILVIVGGLLYNVDILLHVLIVDIVRKLLESIVESFHIHVERSIIFNFKVDLRLEIVSPIR